MEYERPCNRKGVSNFRRCISERTQRIVGRRRKRIGGQIKWDELYVIY